MLIHYTIVRRDLPLGTLAAMVAHAAGESAAFYENPENGRGFRGSVVVVLEVKNEAELKRLSDRLTKSPDLQHIVTRESTPPYNGAWMAIGIVPIERELAAPYLESLQTLKTLDPQEVSV